MSCSTASIFGFSPHPCFRICARTMELFLDCDAYCTSIPTAQKAASLRNISHHTIGGFILSDVLGSDCQSDAIKPPDIIANRGFSLNWITISLPFHHCFEDEVANSVPNSITYVVVMSLHGDWRHDVPTAVARDEDETGGGGG